MKILNIAVFALSFPLVSFASELIYPDSPVAVVEKNAANNLPSLQKAIDGLGLSLSASDFVLKEVKESLLGAHYIFQQFSNGFEVLNSQLIISVDSAGNLTKAFNSAGPLNGQMKKASIPFISKDQALELAWKKLEANGELLHAPVVKLVYGEDLSLIYQVQISTSSPFGHWDITLDAQSGKVLELKDHALPRMKRAGVVRRLPGLATSLSVALKALDIKAVKKMVSLPLLKVDGTAQIFDPNPVVSLARTDLTDTSDASEFTQAYKNEDLKDISMENGAYVLKGPHVTIIDFESPVSAPSTSADGSWMFERGNLAFNDAMTYHHIDKSIRYIESMGFKGSKVIFPKSLEVDSNGVDGDDNSHYIPSSKQLAFGHGCVDDNEDSDVVLHELGHAIQDHITNWGGGDSGAMGEGFGDYWAASYSYTTERGQDTNPNWVFKWDGHNDCWPGRKLDSFTPGYNATKTYSAHSRVDGGISDELWSTPVYQAFLELYASGVPRSDIDKIVLESHFGLGYGLKMPQMAKSMVKAAKALFPNKNYDQVYTKHFKKMKIL